jgi:hypothetical protein
MKKHYKEVTKMELRTLLSEQIERERDFIEDCEIGTEEYNDSLKRLGNLEDKLADLEKTEAEAERKEKQMREDKRDRFIKNIFEGTKVFFGVVTPFIGLIAITAFERNDTFTSALKGYVNCFLPKKM